VAPAAAQSWLEQFVYEIAMLRFADRFASDHEKGVATWREQNLGTEGVLVHARILHAFFVGPGGAVPRWAPFGSASDRIGDFPTTGFLTDGEFLGMAGALGRFGSYSTGFSVWNRADIVKRALAACAAFADALPADEGDSVRRVCSAAA
jgi:hypothetical protein